MTESSHDKQWAKAYLLDPLTSPEPSQETGIASSHNLSARLQNLSLGSSNSSQDKNSKDRQQTRSHQKHNRNASYPIPLLSTSPSRSQFNPSNPFSSPSDVRHSRFSENKSPSGSPPRPFDPQRSSSSIVTRSTSARAPPYLRVRPEPVHHRSFSAGCDLKRNTSLISRRYPGDMSHRPLDILKKEARAADRSPHLRRNHIPAADTIDALDTIGGTYHHGGPYDATLASRNRNKKYSPVAAVQDTNMEAIRATPQEYIQDSLKKHKPLQGTATIPNGGEDFSGNPIRYEEGADLMREPDAAGGAYKRWDGIQYHPEDLKGKGEPSYTFEKDLKEHKRLRNGEPGEYELQSGTNGNRRPPMGHNRSHSEVPRSSSNARDGFSNDDELRRNNSTGRRRISDGLRRRFGSIRRKKSDEVE